MPTRHIIIKNSPLGSEVLVPYESKKPLVSFPPPGQKPELQALSNDEESEGEVYALWSGCSPGQYDPNVLVEGEIISVTNNRFLDGTMYGLTADYCRNELGVYDTTVTYNPNVCRVGSMLVYSWVWWAYTGSPSNWYWGWQDHNEFWMGGVACSNNLNDVSAPLHLHYLQNTVDGNSIIWMKRYTDGSVRAGLANLGCSQIDAPASARWESGPGDNIYLQGQHLLFRTPNEPWRNLRIDTYTDACFQEYQSWLQIPSIPIPRGARITRAQLRIFPKSFTTPSPSPQDPNPVAWPTVDQTVYPYYTGHEFYILGVDADNSQLMPVHGGSDSTPYHERELDYTYYGRFKGVSSEIWMNGGGGVTPHHYINMTCVIQQFVDRPGWQSGNAILFIIQRSDSNWLTQGTLDFYDYWENSLKSCILDITYETYYTEPPSGGIKLGGIAFTPGWIRESMIGGVKLGGYVKSGIDTHRMSGGVKTNGTLTRSINNATISMSGGVKTDGTPRITYSAKTYTEAMSFGVKISGTNTRISNQTILGGVKVNGNLFGYTCTAARGTNTKVGSSEVAVIDSNNDDGSWNYSAINYSTLRLDWGFSDGMNMWLRFNNINIWQGNTINYAHIEFYRTSSNNNNTQVSIRAENSGNVTSAPLNVRDISGRERTSQGVSWSLTLTPPPDVIESPNIACVIQQIIDRADWVRNNSLMLLLDNLYRGGNVGGTPQTHIFADYGSQPDVAARLVIYYSGSTDVETQGGGIESGGSATVVVITVMPASGGVVVAKQTMGYLDVPNTAVLHLRDASFAFWIKTAKTDPQAVLSGANADRDNELAILVQDNKIRFDNHKRES